MSIKRGGVRRLMGNSILNFHFVFRNTSPMDEGGFQQLILHLLRKIELLPQLHIDTIFFSLNRLYAQKYIQSGFSKQVQKNLGNAKETNEFLKSNLSAHGVGTKDIFVCTASI